MNPLLCAVTEVPENIFLLTDCPHDWLFPQCAAVVHLSSHLLGKQFWGLQCKLLHYVQSSMFLELLKLVPSGNSIFDATNLLTGSPWGCGNNSCRSQSCGTSFLFLTGPHSLRLCMLSIPSSFVLKGLSSKCPNELVNCHPDVNVSLSRNTYRKFKP